MSQAIIHDAEVALTFDAVRERVLAEHAELRKLLHHLVVAARSIEQGETASEIGLRGAISAVVIAFDRHLWTEEKHLVPLLADGCGPRLGEGGSGGPALARHMVDDHRQQREMIFALLSEATAGEKSGALLADDASWLAESLLKDIHEEDEALLGLDGGGARALPMSMPG